VTLDSSAESSVEFPRPEGRARPQLVLKDDVLQHALQPSRSFRTGTPRETKTLREIG